MTELFQRCNSYQSSVGFWDSAASQGLECHLLLVYCRTGPRSPDGGNLYWDLLLCFLKSCSVATPAHVGPGTFWRQLERKEQIKTILDTCMHSVYLTIYCSLKWRWKSSGGYLFTKPRRGEVSIHRYSPTPRWITVLVYTKLVHIASGKNTHFICPKLGWKGDYSCTRQFCFANQWISQDIQSVQNWIFTGLEYTKVLYLQ